MWISHSWSNVWFIHSCTSVWTHGLLSYSTDYDLYYHLFWCSNYATIWPLGATGSWLLCPLTWPHPSISTIVLFNKTKFPGSSCTFSVPALEAAFSQEAPIPFLEWYMETRSWHPFCWSIATQARRSPFSVTGYSSFLNNWWRNIFQLERKYSPNSQKHSPSHGQFIQHEYFLYQSDLHHIGYRNWSGSFSTALQCQVQVMHLLMISFIFCRHLAVLITCLLP